jgi:hypothetical protein
MREVDDSIDHDRGAGRADDSERGRRPFASTCSLEAAGVTQREVGLQLGGRSCTRYRRLACLPPYPGVLRVCCSGAAWAGNTGGVSDGERGLVCR